MATLTQSAEDVIRASKIDSQERLIEQLGSTNTLPLWAQMAKLNPATPNPTCIPHIWRYDQIKPYLLKAGELVTEKQAERRVLMLVNPARGKVALLAITEPEKDVIIQLVRRIRPPC